ncbi:MAG: helix-turn-helix transcriptional regulator [Culturomica sp.]|jgi:DNA-binding CsgD family transcriptional regulator|nr:helix-turn-helix transcriptional regulator [Culturomica sp.]
MNLAKLTAREAEIAEMFAWGASKKEIANHLHVSERTVENHARNIYVKTGCGKVNELSAWWFCTKFNISFDLSPLKRSLFSCAMLIMLAPQVANADNDIVRMFRTRTVSTRSCRTSRRRHEDDAIDFISII